MVVVEEFLKSVMAMLLLHHYIRLFSWVARRLENIVEYPEDYVLPQELRGIQQLYNSGKNELEIAEHYPNIHPELVHLVVEKLGKQNGCVDYMDRLWMSMWS